MSDDSSPKSDPDKDVEIAIEEYNALWAYYIKTLDLRDNVFSYFFKAVTIPTGILAAFLAIAARGAGSEGLLGELYSIALGGGYDAIVFVVSLFFILGFCCYATYTLETHNSRNYLATLKAIRKFWRERFPSLQMVLTIDEKRGLDLTTSRYVPRAGTRRAGTIAFWRSMILATVNSGIGTFMMAVVTRNASLPTLFHWFWLLLVAHAAAYKLFEWSYRSQH
jgi:hypothetical protein